MAILNHQIPIDYDHLEPKKLFLETVDVLGLPKQTLGLMTAANIDKVSVVSEKHGKLTVCAVATAGLTNPITAGDNAYETSKFNTINIILLIDGNLTQSCMVNAMNTITEAKTVALKELDIRSRYSGDLASGTVTDSVVVACTKRGSPIKFAGTATMIGELVGKSVKELVKKVIRKQENLVPGRPLTKRLEERGISIADVAALFSQIYPALHESTEEWSRLTEDLQRALCDQNIGSLVDASLRLDDDAKMGLIPVDTNDKKLVICRILQNVVAEYLSKKGGELGDIGPDPSSVVTDKMGLFTGSILFAIMKSVYSNIVENHS